MDVNQIKTLFKKTEIIFWLSFIIGTFLFLTVVLIEVLRYDLAINNEFEDCVWNIGFIYVTGAMLINLRLFIHLRATASLNPHYEDEIIKKSRLLLTNIPVVILYLLIIFNTF